MDKKITDVVDEIRSTAEKISGEEIDALCEKIISADRVFVAGFGRSGLVARAFAMRLMQMGLTSYFVGEVVTPAIHKGDLLLITSGSGSTGSLVAAAEKAVSIGAEVALVTIHPDSKIGRLASTKVKIDAPTFKAEGKTQSSIQPQGSLFEQTMFILLDYMVMVIMGKKGIPYEEIYARHANLE